MTSTNDRTYYEARAKAERQLAESAGNSVIAGLHVQLAEEYERRIHGDSGPIGTADDELSSPAGFETIEATIHHPE